MAEALGDGPPKDSGAPPKKKSLFGNPAWSKPQESEEGIDFFSRAKEIYPMRVAEEERKRRKKLEKQKQESKMSAASAERKTSITPAVKRRRISSQAEDGTSSSNSPNSPHRDDVFTGQQDHPHSTSPVIKPESPKTSQASSTTLSTRYSRALNVKAKEPATSKATPKGYISLSDSEDAGGETEGTKKEAGRPISLDDDDDDVYPVKLAKPSPPDEDPLLSDEEFPELVQRARERERQKELERLTAAKSFAEQNHSRSAAISTVDVFRESSEADSDPVVEILVSSYIEGTKPLMVRRRLNQRLKEVRLSWCDKQVLDNEPLPAPAKASIFLTWNGKRLFDASTCKHLGVKVGKNGKFSSEGDGFDEQGRLHLEAWTEELFVAYQNHLQSQQEGGENDEEPEESQDSIQRVKLLVKAKDFEPFKMRVKATTTIAKMIRAYRDEKGIPAEKELSLYFDGDKLDEALRVDETELTDMDTVEVHIR